MLKNYITLAMRILLRHKVFSIINLGGLTIGLTSAFIIILFVKSQVGYDTWVPSAEKIYTVETFFLPPGRAPKTLARSPLELRATMEKDFPEISSFTRLYAGIAPVTIAELQFPEPAFRIEETFFNVFDFSFSEGTAETALNAGRAVVISQQFANKYFSRTSALGKVVAIGDQDYQVSGVLAAFPGKSHMDFEILLFDGPGALNKDFIDWTSTRVFSYFKLADTATIDRIVADATSFLDQNAFFAPESWHDFKPSEVMSLSFLPLADIHLHQTGENPISPPGDATLVYSFVGIAALILAMAGINFINLSTANASTREKEIAIRKIVGAKRQQLIVRHLAEALILVGMAFIFALSLTEILTPLVFNWIGLEGFSGTTLGFDFLILAAAASLITGILAALYPAFHLSSKSPASALAGGRSATPRVARFRLGLILVQYTVSIVLVIAASHFYLQTRLATAMDLGFEAENIVAYHGLSGAPDFTAQQALIARAEALFGVVSATRMVQLPGSSEQNNVNLSRLGGAETGNTMIQAVAAGVHFEDTLGMTLLAGRSFSADRPVDALTPTHAESAIGDNAPASIIINELALQALGFTVPQEAIGKSYRMQDYFSEPLHVQIIGVIKNAHFQSIHSEMVPMLFANAEPVFNAAVFKLKAGRQQETLQELDAIWQHYVPNVPVYTRFLTEQLASQYASETQQTQVFGGFAALAVAIAFLGIFGLAAFSVERRTREVGVRKVFGASSKSIVRLFVWQFSKPVLWASLIAWPIAGLLIQSWLENYAYRIELLPLVFISAASTVLLIAWVTVAGHAARVARTNPILALRYE